MGIPGCSMSRLRFCVRTLSSLVLPTYVAEPDSATGNTRSEKAQRYAAPYTTFDYRFDDATPLPEKEKLSKPTAQPIGRFTERWRYSVARCKLACGSIAVLARRDALVAVLVAVAAWDQDDDPAVSIWTPSKTVNPAAFIDVKGHVQVQVSRWLN